MSIPLGILGLASIPWRNKLLLLSDFFRFLASSELGNVALHAQNMSKNMRGPSIFCRLLCAAILLFSLSSCVPVPTSLFSGSGTEVEYGERLELKKGQRYSFPDFTLEYRGALVSGDTSGEGTVLLFVIPQGLLERQLFYRIGSTWKPHWVQIDDDWFVFELLLSLRYGALDDKTFVVWRAQPQDACSVPYCVTDDLRKRIQKPSQ